MPNIELKLDYVNNTFGEPDRKGEWPIRGDVKKYSLEVDQVPVIEIETEYQRFDSSQPNYSCVYISYYNNFFRNLNPEYNNKGYATLALKMITKELLKERIPRLSLYITEDNERSLSVAANAGYQRVSHMEYSVFHPNAIELYEEGLKYLKDDSDDLYFLQMDHNLTLYQKYLEALQEKQEVKHHK